jgi:hypothetical protein
MVATIFVRRMSVTVSVAAVAAGDTCVNPLARPATASRCRGARGGCDHLAAVASRPFPHPGAPAWIVHFGGTAQPAVIVHVREEGRRLIVRAEEGEELEFVLSRSSARYVSAAGAHGPRLRLASET